MTLSRAARDLASEGWAIFPCAVRDKRPIVAHGLHAATTDAEQVREWWHRWPNANIGYATGALTVVEIDAPEGTAHRREQEAAGLDWPVTLTVMTGRGAHFYYRCPEGVRVQNAAGMRGARGIGPGIDVRGHGGYVILPPSIHPSGRRYRWTVRREAAELPSWMLERLKPSKPISQPERPASPDRVLEWALSDLEAATPGQRNHELNRISFKLGLRGWSEDDALAALVSAAVACGLSERESERTITSGVRAGEAKR